MQILEECLLREIIHTKIYIFVQTPHGRSEANFWAHSPFFFSGPLFQKVRPKRAGPKWSRRSLKQKALPKPGPATAVKPCPQTRPRLIRAWQCLSPVVPISGVAPFVLLDSTFSIEYSSRLCVRHDLIVPHRKLSALGHGAGWIWGVMMQLVFGLMESIEKNIYIYSH